MPAPSTTLSASPENVLSVGDFTGLIKELLETNLDNCWIRGEVSNLRQQSSGHIYFTLKDDRSQLSCVLFRGDAARQSLLPKEGTQIIVFGRINVYEPRGNYQLIVRMVVADGRGALQARFEELKKRLEAEGLFAAETKRPMPLVALRLAVVTSPTGAAIQDFTSILQRRGWDGRVTIVPAKVQGDGAAEDIVTALDWIEAHRDDFDLIVVTRGGGSLEDLWPFNEEMVVRAIARRSLPLISAVGHEIDFTLSDFAADLRAETPSGAAELISSWRLDLLEKLADLQRRIALASANRFERLSTSLSRIQLQLKALTPERRLEAVNLRLDDLAERLRERTERRIADLHKRTDQLQSRLALASPRARIQLLQTQLTHISGRAERATDQALARSREAVRTISLRLENSSIRKTLQRGFAITRHSDGSIITRAAELENSIHVKLEYVDGTRHAVISDDAPPSA